MKRTYRTHNFRGAQKKLLGSIIEIVEEYDKQNIKLTLRQLYYQLVARDIIPNTVMQYKKLSRLVTNARYAGYIDWDVIVDRVRVPDIPSEWDDVPSFLDSVKWAFKLPRWSNQEYYVELHTEKDALYSVLDPIATRWHVPLSVNRGYTSASAAYVFSNRVLDKLEEDKKVIILYLGDHDPSGLDMVRDVDMRLHEFLYYEHRVNIEHIALTKEQIDKYNPPPNPAKLSDPRSTGYMVKHGSTSWEVDALRPEVMMEIVEDSIKKYVDMNKWYDFVHKENQAKIQLDDLIDKFGEDDEEEV